jgi:hypothetical protein
MAYSDKVAIEAKYIQPGWLISCPDQTGGYKWAEAKAVRPAEDRPGYTYVDAEVITDDLGRHTFLVHLQNKSLVLVRKPI